MNQIARLRLLLATAVLLTATTVASAQTAARDDGLSARMHAFLLRDKMPACKLPPGRLRVEWEYVRTHHPNGRFGEWYVYLSRFYFLAGEQSYFERVVPENHAIAPDRASAPAFVDGSVPADLYQETVGPANLPAELRQRPRMSASQAWRRVKQALATFHVLPEDYKLARKPELVILQDEWNSDHLRLVWRFVPEKAHNWAIVDTSTGEVLAIGFPAPGDGIWTLRDPLEVLERHDLTWIKTLPEIRRAHDSGDGRIK
ncbi:MAG TPA: hypothetical protein VKT77_20340 [Chthonomonadaceae bacterium]|nr:hypothetical protein [Chthonomonadaceae bacterium]